MRSWVIFRLPGLVVIAACMAFRLDAATVTFEGLLSAMTNRALAARWPDPEYRCLQASSYNRASTHRDQPGWFADSDGTGFLRTETIAGRTEWVLMEHAGPGCITKMWTPFFYYAFGERKGPTVRIYLDGSETPVLDEGLIALTRGEGSLNPPFGAATARAGNTYLPIPFAKSCRVTMTAKPFYFLINYRAYPEGTAVDTFTPDLLKTHEVRLREVGQRLYAPQEPGEPDSAPLVFTLAPQATQRVDLPEGSRAVEWLQIRLPEAVNDASILRALVLAATFDGGETVKAPVGDLFCSPDAIHPFETWERTVASNGTLTIRWPMPYARTASLQLLNRGVSPVRLELAFRTTPWPWDEHSMHFHAIWRPDDYVPGTPFLDWTFAEVRGRGVMVGDAWSVLNPTQGWWGEGDEKIYVDGDWARGFPSHFGTGTEDYYGWAGGEVPSRADEFDEPFLANVRVGGVDGNHTRGFNICTRTRVLDAIPFREQLRFDMEASAGTSQRRATDLLGYSAVTFFYARPGATHVADSNAPAAGYPLMSLAQLERMARDPKAARRVPGILEAELLKPVATTPGLAVEFQRPAAAMRPAQWSGEAHAFIPAVTPGAFAEWLVTEQFQPAHIRLYLTHSYDFGIASVYVNGRKVATGVDLYSETPTVQVLDLGGQTPVDNGFRIRLELESVNSRGRGARTYMGLDGILIASDPLPIRR